ncbi:MAG: type II secretion system F family protein [bacterium]|nr:type II secretion system F family protein [bacterium]
MPNFRYQVKDAQGQVTSGVVEAPDERIAGDTLRDRGLEIIYLEKQEKSLFHLPLTGRIGARDFVFFSRQLSVLISASLPLVQALSTVARQTVNKYFQKIIQEAADEVEAGAKLSSALGAHADVFDDFFVNMIKSGETSGRLDEVLNYLADQKEKDYDLMSKIRGAMIYPSFIIVAMFGIGIVLMVFVIPQLTGVLLESGATLPLSTRILIGASGLMQKYWILFLAGLVGAAGGFRYTLKKNQTVRFVWDSLKLRLPIVGPIFQKIYLVRFCRSMETLISGGVDMVGALTVAANVVQNVVYKDLIARTVKQVEDGNPLTSVFSQSKLVPPMVNQMLSVGEETGRLTDILKKLSSFYTREIENGVANLVSVIEPLIMIIIGVAVGVIVSAIIMPMYKLAEQF